MYKKIYLEITNVCNLECDFCIKNSRKKEYISIDNFNYLLNKLEGYTNYLYFHVMGEPLMHPKINELIDLGSRKYKINLTTNGYLLNRIKYNKNIRQINISLHSFNNKYNVSFDDYMNKILDSIDELKKNTYISLRFWLRNNYTNDIINAINNYYNVNINIKMIKNNTRIVDNVFISLNDEFIWPDLNNDYYNEIGTCYALKDHIGILVDGTIVPCCLDSKGIINLGNIYKDNLDCSINSDRYKDMLDGFKNNKKCELLCRKCQFIKNNNG